MKHLHLIVPLRMTAATLHDQAAMLAPSLVKLLSRGHPRRQDSAPDASLAAACCRAFGVEKQLDWPLAAVTAHIDGLAPATDYWLRIDPVHLEVGIGGLILHDPALLQLGEQEAADLKSSINRHLIGTSILSTHPNRWHLRLGTPPKLATTPLDRLHGAYLSPHLPSGEDAPYFMRLVNDAQMVLHDHPVNLAREKAGRPVINGLWLWGGGRFPDIARTHDLVAAAHPVARALAEATGCALAPHPGRIGETDAWSQAERVLSVLPDPDAALTPAEHLSALEASWFRPLLRRLARGQVRTLGLELLVEPNISVTLDSLRVWQFWRRRLAPRDSARH